MRWEVGQHLLLIGGTGTGKTYLALDLLTQLRRWVLAATTKRDTHVWWGFQTVDLAAKIKPTPKATRWRLHPSAKGLASLLQNQRTEIGAALERAYQDGGWTVYVDELFYSLDRLKLDEELVALVSQGRSEGISFVGGVQRPSEVRWFLSECRYVAAFRMGSGLDRKALGDHFGRDWSDTLEGLPSHVCSLIDKATGEVVEGKAPEIVAALRGVETSSHQEVASGSGPL